MRFTTLPICCLKFATSTTHPKWVPAVALAVVKRAEELGAGEILITSVDREGTGSGFDLDLIGEITEAVRVPVIGHGGAGRRVDLAAPVHEAGASAVAAGTLFVFQGPGRGVLINYPPRRQIEKILNAVDRPPIDGQLSA